MPGSIEFEEVFNGDQENRPRGHHINPLALVNRLRRPFIEKKFVGAMDTYIQKLKDSQRFSRVLVGIGNDYPTMSVWGILKSDATLSELARQPFTDLRKDAYQLVKVIHQIIGQDIHVGMVQSSREQLFLEECQTRGLDIDTWDLMPNESHPQ